MQEPPPLEPRNDPPGLAQPFGDLRYSRWDGTQRLDALEAEELLGAMADELLSGGDLEDAMARLSRWGIPGRMEGLKDLLERLRTAKQRRAQRHDLSKTFDDLKEKLEGSALARGPTRPAQPRSSDEQYRHEESSHRRMPLDRSGDFGRAAPALRTTSSSSLRPPKIHGP